LTYSTLNAKILANNPFKIRGGPGQSIDTTHLSRRERQIMEIIYRRGSSTTTEVFDDLGQIPGYSAVRTLLRILEEKGHLRHEKQGKQFLFFPINPRENAMRSAFKNLVDTFFDNSATHAFAALLEVEKSQLTDNDLQELADLIEKTRREGY
jgi:BlaI family penicillinase repressor